MYLDNRFMDVTEWNTSYGFIKGYFHIKEIVGIELKFFGCCMKCTPLNLKKKINKKHKPQFLP